MKRNLLVSALLTLTLVACGGGGGGSSNSDSAGGNVPKSSVQYPSIYASLLVDVNGDGKLDLVTGGPFAGDRVQLGNGDGTFKTATSLPDHYLKSEAQTVFFAALDVNKDGHPDLLSISVDGRPGTFYGSSQIQLFINDGTGKFTDGNSRLPGGGLLQEWPGGVLIADFDGDGHVDLLLSQGGCPNGKSPSMCYSGSIWLNNGSGSFVPSTIAVTTANLWGKTQIDTLPSLDIRPGRSTTGEYLPSGWGNVGFMLADVDGDGKPDAIGSGGWSYLNRSTPGVLKFDAVFWQGNAVKGTAADTLSGFRGGAFIDYNGDGLLDFVGSSGLASSASTTVPIQVFKNIGGGRFQEDLAALTTPIGLRHARQWLVADFDGDGRKDIYIADHGWDYLPFPGAPNVLIRNLGNGKLSDASSGLSRKSTFTHGASLGDVNGDGRIDLFENNNWQGLSAEQDAYIFLNQGALKFVAF